MNYFHYSIRIYRYQVKFATELLANFLELGYTCAMITYKLTRKRNMKNIRLRVSDGEILVSAPMRTPIAEIDKFVQSKTDWIRKRLAEQAVPRSEPKIYDDNECLELFGKIAKNVYPLIKNRLPKQPVMYVKDYKSRWGVCYWQRGYIILNKRLFDKPTAAIEYVILHEYVHFLVPNHGEKFHKIMAELMPDYKARRKLLRGC